MKRQLKDLVIEILPALTEAELKEIQEYIILEKQERTTRDGGGSRPKPPGGQ